MARLTILFLDDRHSRCAAMQEWLPGVLVCRSAAECIHELTGDGWDLVMLDHDLDGRAGADGQGANTGTAVARWMAINRPPVGCVAIHSRNVSGSREMEEILKAAGYLVRQVCFDDLPEALGELLEWASDQGKTSGEQCA